MTDTDTSTGFDGPTSAPDQTTPGMGERARELFRGPLAPARLSALYLLIFFFVLFGILQPGTFLTTQSVNLVLSQGVITAILAFAFLLPMSAGAYDLSIGANMSLGLLMMNYLGIHTGLPAGIDVVIALLSCAIVGAINGFIILKLRVNSFIATLGTSQVVSAVVLLLSKDTQITGAFSQQFLNLGQNNLLGVPIVVYYLAVIAIILFYVLEYTPVGRFLYATGGNAEAARLAGIPTHRYVWSALIMSGILAGFGGCVFAVQVGTFSSDVGPGYLFPAIAAVFFGAVQFSQRPNIIGTLLALYSLAFGVKGLELSFNSGVYWIDPLFQGLSLVMAVALASRQGVIRVRKARQRARGRLLGGDDNAMHQGSGVDSGAAPGGATSA